MDMKMRALERLSKNKHMLEAVAKFKLENADKMQRLPHLFNLWEIQHKDSKRKPKRNKIKVSSESNETKSPPVGSKAMADSTETDPVPNQIQRSKIITINAEVDRKNHDNNEYSNLQQTEASKDGEGNTNDNVDDKHSHSDASESEADVDLVTTPLHSDMVIRQINLDDLSDDELPAVKSISSETLQDISCKSNSSHKNKSPKKSFFLMNSDDDDESPSSDNDYGNNEKLTEFVGNRRQRRQQAFGRMDTDTNFRPKKERGGRSKFEKSGRGSGFRGRGGASRRGNSLPNKSGRGKRFNTDNSNFVQPDNDAQFRKFNKKEESTSIVQGKVNLSASNQFK